ncbi:MAG TPA: molybdenum cofactor guanylyltransferase [Candidatus Cybelea sp.]|nr:molybdenum cofactor guanylyltransferase [Candidatus Cybelea sp.]
MPDAILLLAGGSATRFPGKLEHDIEGQPMIVRVFARLALGRWPVYVAGKGSFAPGTDAALGAPLLIDRWTPRGPLHALLSASPFIAAERIFAVAADQPQLDPSVLERLAAAWQPGDEAVVPEHSGGIEPLAALYDRFALLREGLRLRRAGRTAMRDLIAAIATRFVPLERRYFRNVNTRSDLGRRLEPT